MEGILTELRSKANNAKMHALELYPQLLAEEDVQRPSWGSSFPIGKDLSLPVTWSYSLSIGRCLVL